MSVLARLSGLSPRQMAACDYLTYIPQYGAGTASLNVSNAAAIILHRFADWAGYQEQAVEGAKFIVDDSRLVRNRDKTHIYHHFAFLSAFCAEYRLLLWE